MDLQEKFPNFSKEAGHGVPTTILRYVYFVNLEFRPQRKYVLSFLDKIYVSNPTKNPD